MGFGWADAAVIAAQAIGSAMSGGGGSGDGSNMLSNLHLVNPAQQALYNTMAKGLLSGSGDFGGGAAYKQGYANLSDMMAQRGISPQSGVAMQAIGNLGAQAGALDQQNRMQNWFQLMGTPLQTAQVAGANYVHGSPSVGPTTDSQQYNFANKGPQYGQYNWY